MTTSVFSSSNKTLISGSFYNFSHVDSNEYDDWGLDEHNGTRPTVGILGGLVRADYDMSLAGWLMVRG